MPLLTGQNVIDWLQQDPALLEISNFLVPHVQNFIVEQTKNSFVNTRVVLQAASGLAFVHSEPDTITNSNSDFITNGYFAALTKGTGTKPIDISVRGSRHNDAIFPVTDVAAATITLDQKENLIVETPDIPVTIFQVKWPRGLPIIAARMVGHLLDKKAAQGVKSFSLADWSVDYGDGVNTGSFPDGMIKSLNVYRQTRGR